MSQATELSQRPTNGIGSPRAFALVLVLGCIALLVVLAVGFISSVRTEGVSSSGFNATVSARQLADMAVSLVQGQINTATTQGYAIAWTSQPGMVRTFDATSGNLINAYKLYSAADMISGSISLTADYPSATWADDTAIWTDLNAPVEVDGMKNYPILDPAATAEGFQITGAPGVTGSSYQTAPMPIRWLYVLKDGQVVPPSETSGKTATIPGATSASGSNPIIGRIAFWTDDETCKVNINTASEGTYWDVPRARTNQELAFAQKPPWQKEFQRYPGHPAMTSLSAVFPKPTGETDQTWAEKIYKIIPRVIGGGSMEGTVIPTASSAALQPDSDRLYANIGELAFAANREPNPTLTQAQIRQAKFFLTAHSRGPETNLFNLPRVACWPLFKNLATDRVTSFDRLIAFCASTGSASNTLPYYFQREQAASTTNDISIARNGALYSYLQYLTGQNIPGVGGNFSAKYGADRDQILTEIFDYIRCANLNDPTLGASQQFTPGDATAPGHGCVAPTQYTPPGGASTMGFGRAYTLSEAGLGLICNATADATGTTNESAGSNIATGVGANAVLGGVPLSAGQKYIQAIFIPEFFCAMGGYTSIHPNMRIEVDGLNKLTITKGSVTAQLFPDVADGSSASYTDDPINFWGGANFGGNPNWRYFGFMKTSPARGNLAADPATTGCTEYPFIGKPIKITAPATGYNQMAFSGGTATLRIYSAASGGDLIQTISINFPASSNFPIPNLVNAAVGTDTAAANWWAFSRTGAVNGAPGRLNFIHKDSGTIYGLKSGCFFIKPGTMASTTGPDVVKTVLPRHGDFRLVAATQNVPAAAYPEPATPGSAFYKHRTDYDNKYVMVTSNLGSAANTLTDSVYDFGGKYISTITYPKYNSPAIPSDATQTPESTGDFDNCLPPMLEGPFVNKPDEGSDPSTPSPYFNDQYATPNPAFFSPNRQMPSPGMFGSLPTGVKAGTPWQTLLFRPQPSHPQSPQSRPGMPADHLFMDLFWMPVVEPYAISDRFSTAGKINLNYQILPFTYIERSTGLRALLKSEMVAAVPNSAFNPDVYKYPGQTSTAAFRLSIDSAQTLSQFETNKFSLGQVFRSASEICDLHIVPTGQTVASMSTYWSNDLASGHALTAENLREKIYTTLYPRLTTKSNTYTIHFCAQALKQVPSSTGGTWTDAKDVILGEYRGSATLERFIDANNPKIPDYAAHPANIPTLDTLDKYYRWRVVENRQFAP